jgi:hypothetical protein
LLSPAIYIAFSYVSKSQVFSNEQSFMDKWGSFYYEFKNDKGFLSTQHYFIYLIRRLIFILVQVGLNSNVYIQGGIIIFSSLLPVVFLLYYLPFKELPILISNIISEVCCFALMSLFFVFLFDLSEETKISLEESVILIIIGSMASNMIITMYSSFSALKKALKSLIIDQAEHFVIAVRKQLSMTSHITLDDIPAN